MNMHKVLRPFVRVIIKVLHRCAKYSYKLHVYKDYQIRFITDL